MSRRKSLKNVSSVTRALCREETRAGKVVEAACAKDAPNLRARGHHEATHRVSGSFISELLNHLCRALLRCGSLTKKFWKEMIDIETLPHDDWMFTPDHLKDEALKEKL